MEAGIQAGQILQYYANDRMTIHGVDPASSGEHIWKAANAFANPEKVYVYRKKVEDCHEIKENSVDYVVCVTLFCCVDDMDKSLNAIHRVLKPDGKFFFSEHVIHPSNPVLRTFQHLLDPLHQLMFGCHWNRDFISRLEQNKFKIERINDDCIKQVGFYIPITMGVAVKES
eukprot:TRINITY_DN2092_c0_g1_i2.p3 TRINITY_DN2092_c0_g1~~TRINITY_DN2092_c0_g1_i2.p3  ORF type:complete len:171 (+),score=21.54 TRINITY_DN2092_c0_g1_i2:239-751(+)